jgi:hypothetical protein
MPAPLRPQAALHAMKVCALGSARSSASLKIMWPSSASMRKLKSRPQQ